MAPPVDSTKISKDKEAAQKVIVTLHEMANLLNTGLTRQQLSYCISLIENGVNPEALAVIIKELREMAQENAPA